MKLLVYGLFGGHNFGDELFSKVIVERINSEQGLETPALFTENADISRATAGEIVPITGFPKPTKGLQRWRHALSQYRSGDGLLFGGGGLFNEVFLRAGVPAQGLVLATSKLYGIPYIMHGIEIGYVGTRLNRFVTGWVLRNARRVICRNPESVERAEKLAGVTPTLGYDINHGWLHRQMNARTRSSDGRPRFVINLQHSLRLDDPDVFQLLTKKKADHRIVFLVNTPGEKNDVAKHFGAFADEIDLSPTVTETISVLREGDAFLTERFHFTMAALHANAPATVIVSSTKVRNLLKYLEDRGAPMSRIREGAEKREIVEVPPSPQRRQAVEFWAQQSDQQLETVLTDIRSTGDTQRGKFHWKYLPIVVSFYGIFFIQYALDRLSPLRRHLDLSKT